MKYIKCPECELNYIPEGEKFCSDCRRRIALPFRDLVRGKESGTNSRDVYEECAKRYRWDMSQANQFGKLGLLLYALKATPEKFSVWFIAHSNWTGDKGGKWQNEISLYENTIEVIWDDPLSARAADFTTCVVYAKNQYGQYEFLGVYKPDRDVKRVVKDGSTRGIVTFHCISEGYPIKAD